MTRILSCVLLFAAALAVDPMATGTWSIDGDVQGYPIKETCVFTQTDAALGGTCTQPGTTTTVPVTGKVSDKSITFSHAGTYQGEALTLTYAGTIATPGTFSGTIDVQPLDYQGTFTATMATAKPVPAPPATAAPPQ